MKKLFTIAIITLLAGCATTDAASIKSIWEIADERVLKNDFIGAWNTLTTTPPGLDEKTREYLSKQPSVYAVGKERCSLKTLREQENNKHLIEYSLKTYGEFVRFASAEDIKWAEKNITKVFGNNPAETLLNKETKYGRVLEFNLKIDLMSIQAEVLKLVELQGKQYT